MHLDPEELRSGLEALGFDVVRFARATTSPGGERWLEWLARGYQADMTWLDRSAEGRLNPEVVLPGVGTLILLGVNYGPGADSRESPLGEHGPGSRPRWARYALHTDYHDTIKPGLQAAGQFLERALTLTSSDYRYYVDTGPVLERGWAARSGMGFVGKNGMLISRDYGNWLFLAAILVRAEIPEDPPLNDRARQTAAPGLLCGKCTRCMDACPTAAIPAPGQIDARRCISYQTIENKGIIPRELRASIGERIYGCDICAEVCPWNRFAQHAKSLLLEARPEIDRLSLAELLALTPEGFARAFKGTPMKRVKLRGLLRNASIVAANTKQARYLPALVHLATHPEPIVRAHAVWAVLQLGGRELLSAAFAAESDPRVLDEYAGELENAPAPHESRRAIAL